MPPPSSFILIDTIPFSRLVTLAEFNVALEQWFKYVATVPIVLGIQTSEAGNFTPRVQIYESDGTTLISSTQIGIYGWWFPLRTAADYYIKIIKLSPTVPSDSDFTFTADTRPLDVITAVAGDLIVNDDASASELPGGGFLLGWPAIVISQTTPVKFFINDIPSGEFGAILPTNESVWHDRYGRLNSTDKIAVFDSNFGYVTSVSCNIGISNLPVFATDVVNNKFYVTNQSRELWTISSAGVAANTGYVFPAHPAHFPEVLAVNETGTILYWIDAHATTAPLATIHRLNLTTLTPLSDFYSIPGFSTSTDRMARTPNSHAGDMFVMPNGNVVTWWQDGTGSFTAYHLLVISNAGVLLHSHDYMYPVSIDHLAYISGDSDHIIVWWYTTDFLNEGRYGRITLSTGVIDQDFLLDMFNSGTNLSGGPDKFGPSNSCTFVRVQGVVAGVTEVRVTQNVVEVLSLPPDVSGIYYINPANTHDSYYGDIEKKIPNPTVKTAFIGE